LGAAPVAGSSRPSSRLTTDRQAKYGVASSMAAPALTKVASRAVAARVSGSANQSA
jgi:hypothetical protein